MYESCRICGEIADGELKGLCKKCLDIIHNEEVGRCWV